MKIGFIGLGIMGRPMSKNLIRSGFNVVVFARKENVMDELVAIGATKATSVADLAEQCDVIITMLPDSPEVKEIILGPGGVIHHAKPGSMVIDMSSIDPSQTKLIGEALSEHGIRMMDAPVSGGEAGAISRKLVIMVGGEEKDFEEYKGLLEAMGSAVTYMGDLGAGNVTKLVNQIMVGLNMAAVAEAMVFAKKSGVDPSRVYEAIHNGSSGSKALDTKLPRMVAHDFQPGFRLELHRKDLTNAVAAADSIEAQLPQTQSLLKIMKQMEVEGHSLEDHTAILRYFEGLSKALLIPLDDISSEE